MNLFVGLLVHGVLSEAVGQAPALMQRNSNFVRKMVFPLPVLVAVPIGSALVNMMFGLGLVVAVNGFFGTGLHLAVLWLPLLLIPYLCLVFGLALMFSALGVYIRDLAQITSMLVMVLLFTGPVFFPRTMVPERLAGLIDFNPITWPTEALRACLLHGEAPALMPMLVYSAAAMVVLLLGWRLFALLKRGFADLL